MSDWIGLLYSRASGEHRRVVRLIFVLLIFFLLGCAPRATISKGEKEKIHTELEELLKSPLLKPATLGMLAITERGLSLIHI